MIMSLNIRELVDLVKRRFIKDAISKADVDVFSLQETKMVKPIDFAVRYISR